MHFQPQQGGYSLVETLIAILVLLIALVTPMTIVVNSMRSAWYATEQATALFLAQEGIEVVQAYRNSFVIDDIVNNNSNNTWGWTGESTLIHCFTDDGQGGDEGCNVDTDSPDPFLNAGSVKRCGTGNGNDPCRMEIENDSDSRARYVLGGVGVGDEKTIYTRVIQLESIGAGVKVTATVSWEARLFSGNEQKVVLETVLYDTYGDN